MNKLSTIVRFINKAGPHLFKSPSPVAVFNIKFSTTSNPAQLKLEKESFQDVWPNLVRTIVQDKKIARLPDLATWIQKVLDYNTTGGKMLRGLATVFAYECVEKPEHITAESMELARIMGWCVEILQGYFVMLDDIMDGATTRRGQLCWHNRPEVGQGLAINDSIFLHMSLLIALKKYFSDHPSYKHMTQLFNDVLLSTAMGQHLDIVTAKMNYSAYTMEHLNAIAKYKTAYYTFQLPVSLGLLLANITDEKVHNQVEDICVHLGKLFQMQDDYLDCFGEESVTGKIGTDIQEGKCTWFAVQALSRCDDKQKQIFTNCYGSDHPENIETIRRLYKELGLVELFDEHDKRTSELIVRKSAILETSTGVPAQLTTTLLDMLRKRKH